MPAMAASYRAVVTHVTDGDTLWVRPTGQTTEVELRLLHPVSYTHLTLPTKRIV